MEQTKLKTSSFTNNLKDSVLIIFKIKCKKLNNLKKRESYFSRGEQGIFVSNN